jgi:hypothetical protein
MQALVEVGERVVGKCRSVHEPAPPVERQRGFEGGAGAGFEAWSQMTLGCTVVTEPILAQREERGGSHAEA